jgi:hypothetical protein
MTGTREPLMICLLDVLGFENRLAALKADGMLARYTTLIEYVKKQTGGVDVVPTPDGHVAVGWLVIGNAYFSDTLLFWTKYSKMSLPNFTHCIAEAICFGLDIELPLRGAIAVGDAILDRQTGVFLGEPLVEVARTEREQRWVGVSFGPSFARPGFNDGFHLNTLLPYKSHYKDGLSAMATGMTVDWPRQWRESRKTDPRPILRSLNTDPKYSPAYERTEQFIDFSEVHHDWFREKQHLDYG